MVKDKIMLVFFILSTCITIYAFSFNFEKALKGNATIENFYISIIFILIWAGFALCSRKFPNMLIYILVYWLFVFITFCLICIMFPFDSYVGKLHDIALVLYILLGPQMFGLTYFLPKEIIFYIINALIALAFIAYCIINIRLNWYKND